jgi:hypothetical protein
MRLYIYLHIEGVYLHHVFLPRKKIWKLLDLQQPHIATVIYSEMGIAQWQSGIADRSISISNTKGRSTQQTRYIRRIT